jgi:heat shock protein HslJ/uncharacterized membrane protein
MKIFFAFFILLAAVTRCKTGREAIAKQQKQLPVPVLSESLQQKQLNGVDFFARGNTAASWTLEMDFGNLIRFKSLDGTVINSSSVQPQDLPLEKATLYSSKATQGDINIFIYNEACTDVVSGEKYNKKTVVAVNGKRYEGCGQYLFDAALNGKWILQKINNRLLTPADFAKGLPMIDLNLQQEKLSGHDGCNNLFGGFEVWGSKIKFKPIASTKMACPGNKNENEFTHLLSGQTIDYYFKEGQLYFYLRDDSILIFSKN